MAEEAPKPAFTDEQVDGIKQLVTGIVNSAIRSRDQMADKKRAEDREAITSGFAKMLEEKLAGFKPTEQAADDGGGKGKGKNSEVVDATTRRLQQETADRLAAMEKKWAAERAKNEQAELRETVRQTLAGSGISDPTRFKGAYAVLRDRLAKESDDDDSPFTFVDDNGEKIDLVVGLKGWAKSEEAKMYMPPSGAAGSGARRSTNPLGREGKTDTTYEDVGNFVLGLTAPMGARLGE